MNRMMVRGALAAAFSMVALSAFAAPAITYIQTTAGMVMADDKGMVLYTYDRDTAPNVSTCVGGCLTNWPLFKADTGTAGGDWTIVTREDGGKVWSYKGKPLYYYVNDKEKADAKGAAIANWKVLPQGQ